VTDAVPDKAKVVSRGVPPTARAYFEAASRDREKCALRVVSRFVTRGGSTGIGEIGYLDTAHRDGVLEKHAVGRVYWMEKGDVKMEVVEAGWADEVAQKVKARARKIAARILEERDAGLHLWPTFMATAQIADLAKGAHVPKARTGLNEDGRKVWEMLEGHFGPARAVPTSLIAKALGCSEQHARMVIGLNRKFFPGKVEAQQGKGYYLAGNLGHRPTKPLMLPLSALDGKGNERPLLSAPGFKITVTGPGLNVELEADRPMALAVLRRITGEAEA